MKTIICFLFAGLSASILLFGISPAQAATSVICKKTADGALSIRSKRCRSGESRINNVFQISPSIAFAAIRGADGSVISSGGNGTTLVNCVRNGAGDYTVTFSGNFPANVSAEKLTVLATAQSDNYQVTNAAVESASSSSISIRIFAWRSDVASEIDASVFVQVLLGS